MNLKCGRDFLTEGRLYGISPTCSCSLDPMPAMGSKHTNGWRHLVPELLARHQRDGGSFSAWARNAGVGLATVQRFTGGTCQPNSLTVAALGLALGRRLELLPWRSSTDTARSRQPALPEEQSVPRTDAAGLLSLVGAELRHARRAAGITAAETGAAIGSCAASVLRAERPGRPYPDLETLGLLAEQAGCSLTWMPVTAPWRVRPWQLPSVQPPTRAQRLRHARSVGRVAGQMLSLRGDWATPRHVMAEVTAERGCPPVLDAAASVASVFDGALSWLGPDHPDPRRRDALLYDEWARLVDPDSAAWAWLNPPYGIGLSAWTERAVATAAAGLPLVSLLPCRTDTRWWHRDVVATDAVVRFFRGRLAFDDGADPAPFASVLVTWESPSRQSG